MIEFIQNKRHIILTLAIFFVVVSLSGTTYSLFVNVDTTDNFNYNTGTLDLQITEDKQISINNAFPTIDSEGMNSKSYNLTIKNTGTLIYLFDLKMLSTTNENTIDTKYIKVMVDENIPKTLYALGNVIASNVILYPGEEKTFEIRVWLDYNTPNEELGKTFAAKITTTGESLYRTLDTSNANYPDLKENMIPIYFEENTNTVKKADISNMIENNKWYDYGSKEWANIVYIKDSKRKIYDITGKHDITIEKVNTNNRNIIIEEKYLDLGVKFTDNKISNIIRIKFDSLKEEKIYIISNDTLSYYYDTKKEQFNLKVNGVTASSSKYKVEENKWYIIGYTYDGSKVNFYVNGMKVSSNSLISNLYSKSSFKLGTDSKFDKISQITIGDVYVYNDILKESEIEENYKTSINIIYDSLVAGYNEFQPMTLNEYYVSSPSGTTINNNDIKSMYVWIPRFKYQLFNIEGNIEKDTTDTYKKGINISFENNLSKSGVIFCKNSECFSDNLMITKITDKDNGKYYTHPAFTKKDGEIKGFWVSKYEYSDKDIKAGNEALTNMSLSEFYNKIKKIDTNINYHMITNLEWGAVAYLAHSEYGICGKFECTNIIANKTNILGNETKDTTTNNIYGVFDMAGSNAEFVMANYADEFGNLSLNNSNFQDIAISNDDYDLYLKDKFILGDATLEITNQTSAWNNGISEFINDTNNWLVRGGVQVEENGSIFSYRATTDTPNEYISTRITIK